jgi:hypothetical protein
MKDDWQLKYGIWADLIENDALGTRPVLPGHSHHLLPLYKSENKFIIFLQHRKNVVI